MVRWSQMSENDGSIKVELRDVSKTFGKVIALNGLNLDIREGDIHAIVGDNGAGKSTLLNILSGVYQPTGGEIYYNNNRVEFSSPSEARDVGIETVYQDLALMNDLDIATNIYMERFPIWWSLGPFRLIDWEDTYKDARKNLEEFNQHIDPRTEVQYLSGGQRQLVAIVRSLLFDPEVLILDEPTSALSVAGTQLVHDTMNRLKTEGKTQIVVDHNIDEVLEIADRISVMYQGEIVDTVYPENEDKGTISKLLATGKK